MASQKTGAFVGGALLGAALGGVITLLLAPRWGKEIRTLIKRSVDTIPEAAGVPQSDARLQVDRLVRSAQQSLDEMIHKLNEAIEINHSAGRTSGLDTDQPSVPLRSEERW